VPAWSQRLDWNGQRFASYRRRIASRRLGVLINYRGCPPVTALGQPKAETSRPQKRVGIHPALIVRLWSGRFTTNWCAAVKSKHDHRLPAPARLRCLDLIFHSIAFPLDYQGVGVMQQAVQNGAGQGAVVVKDLGPVFIGLVGREHDGTAFLALADDLEEQVGPGFVDGQIADFIDA